MGISFAQLRDLDTTKLTTAADASVAVGKDLGTHAGDIGEAAKRGNGGGFWGGADADVQNALLTTFPPPLHAASGVFKESAATIDNLVKKLEDAQQELETAISSYPRLSISNDGTVAWPPTTTAEDAAQLKADAQKLRAQIDAALDKADAADQEAVGALESSDIGPGKPPFRTKLPDGSVYMVTGNGNDDVKVSKDEDGKTVVRVGDKDYTFDKDTPVAINTRGGDDKVDIDKSTGSGVTLDTGAGKDTVTDHDGKGDRTFTTGDGDDTVETTGDNRNVYTQGGNDTVRAAGEGNNLASGAGNDTVQTTGGKVFGGDGADNIRAGGHDNPFFKGKKENATDVYGGEGDDKIVGSDKGEQIVGGSGNDNIEARGGDDRISGNTGADKIEAGAGNDGIDGGDEDDEIVGGDGNDRISGQGGDDKIQGNDGNDSINGGSGYDKITGGDGDDKITGAGGDDKIYGGAGDDQLRGNNGDDYIDGQDGDDIIRAGDGNDTVYGLDGKDTLSGDAGNDYLEGGRDDDIVLGGDGKDTLSGGRDDDYLEGGKGNDTMYSGHGADSLNGGAGADKNFVQDEDTVTGDKADTVQKVEVKPADFFDIEGSDDFKDRVQADLDLYGSSPTGHHMLDNLRDHVSDSSNDWLPGEDDIKITETSDENGYARDSSGDVDLFNENPHVEINPDWHREAPGDTEGRPSTILYHELSHVYDYVNSGMDANSFEDNRIPDDHKVKNGERAAVGLPVDHDHNPATPAIPDPDHPFEVTENALRREMGLPERPRYD